LIESVVAVATGVRPSSAVTEELAREAFVDSSEKVATAMNE
jgi:hypothetical protein